MRSRPGARSEEHTSELQSLKRIPYAVFCLKKKNNLSSTDPNEHPINIYSAKSIRLIIESDPYDINKSHIPKETQTNKQISQRHANAHNTKTHVVNSLIKLKNSLDQH